MKPVICLGTLATALLAFGAVVQAAPPTDAGAPIELPLDQDLAGADLVQLPKNDDLQREYPPIALMMNLHGQATMTCKALTTGRLDDCHVVSEDPVGMGFGAATVRTAVYFRVKPATRDGLPVDGTITIPLRWQTAGGAPAQPISLAPATPAALALGRRVIQLQDVANRLQSGSEAFLKQQAVQMAGFGDGHAAQALTQAYRLGLADVANAEADRQAHELASTMSAAELKATVDFLQGVAGRALVAAEARSALDGPKDFYQRVSEAARAHYCTNGACPDIGAPSASASR